MEEEKVNKAKEETKKTSPSPVKMIVSGEFLTRAGVAANLPFLLYITGLMLLYTAYGYYVDNTVRKIAKEEKEGEELYSRLQSLMELYDRESLPSKVAKQVGSGIRETMDPPRIIWVENGFYNDQK